MKLQYAAHINRAVLAESTAATFEFAYVDIGAIDDLGTVRVPSGTTTFGSAPSRARRLAPAGATIMSTVRTYLRAIATVPPSNVPLVFSTGFATLEAKPGVDPGYLSYVCRSERFLSDVVSRSTGVSYPSISTLDVADIDVEIPSFDVQREVAEFLDGELARIHDARHLRADQQRALTERLGHLVDGAIAGDAESLATLGCARIGQTDTSQMDSGQTDTSQTDTSQPVSGDPATRSQIARVCDILPGYTFPSASYISTSLSSAGFTSANPGTRLLRGVNIAVGNLDWTETARWDLDAHPIPPRFHLQPSDLVMAMDRPWISGGLRLAVVTPDDVPALLLQRVARMRPRSDVDMGYIRWALSSSHFRNTVESELTGVSVPHLSAEHIGGFALRLPPPQIQRSVAAALDAQASATQQLTAAIDQQISALAERARALITLRTTET